MKWILPLLLTLGCLHGLSQSENWSDYAQKDGVLIQIATVDCNNPSKGTYKQYLLLRVENQNDFPVDFSFDKVLNYGFRGYIE